MRIIMCSSAARAVSRCCRDVFPFEVFGESHAGAVSMFLLFAGQTLPTSSPSSPTSVLLRALSCGRSCRDVGSQFAERESAVALETHVTFALFHPTTPKAARP